MRQQVGNFDKNGDERWYYLEFDEASGTVMFVNLHISKTGEQYETSGPLSQSTKSRGYQQAVKFIRANLFPTPEPNSYVPKLPE
jgi:hypothetical protein